MGMCYQIFVYFCTVKPLLTYCEVSLVWKVEILKDDWMEVLNTKLKRRIKMVVVLKAAVVLAFMPA